MNCFCRSRNRSSAPQWNKQCNISQTAGISFQKSRLFRVQGVKNVTFYEQELQKIVGERYPDATYVGRTCYVQLGDMNRAKIEFVKGIQADRYIALQLTILNRCEGRWMSCGFNLRICLGSRRLQTPIAAKESGPTFGMTAAMWTGMAIIPPGRTMRLCPMRYQTIWRCFRICVSPLTGSGSRQCNICRRSGALFRILGLFTFWR